MPVKNDVYANMVNLTLTESAANTLTFGSIDLGLTIFQKVGLLLNRIVVEYPTQLIGDMGANNDSMALALTQSDQITSISYLQDAVVWKDTVSRRDFGAAASGFLYHHTKIYDFSGLPGGGEIITPRPLYWASQGNGLTTTFSIYMRIFFTILELKSEEYFELLEARRFFGA